MLHQVTKKIDFLQEKFLKKMCFFNNPLHPIPRLHKAALKGDT